MPKLPTFTAQVGGEAGIGGRRMTAPDDGLGALGRGMQKVGDAYLQNEEDKESRTALVSSSEIRAKYARALDDAALTDADTEKLKLQMQDELSKVGEQFQTTRGHQSLDLYSANTELMFDEQANRIKVTRAAAEATLEGQKFLNSESELMRSNPGYVRMAEANAEAFVTTLKNIPPHKRTELLQGLKKELNMASAISAARLDPESTKTLLEKGEWDLTPQQRETAVNKADTEIRARRADEAYQRSVKEYEERERDDKARDKHFAGIIGGTATRRAIMDDADLKPATREHLIDYMEARARERSTQEKKSNPTVTRDLWLRIHAPDTDPRKIFNGDAIFAAVKTGELNTTDANQLNTLVANQKDDNNRTFGARLQGRMQSVIGAMRSSPLYQAQPELAAAIQLEIVAIAESDAAALRRQNKDPNVLLDPDAKEYLFKPNFLKQVADDVKARDAVLAPKITDLRATPDADVPVGQPFVDPKGVTRTMTKELKDALARQPRQRVTGTIEVK